MDPARRLSRRTMRRKWPRRVAMAALTPHVMDRYCRHTQPRSHTHTHLDTCRASCTALMTSSHSRPASSSTSPSPPSPLSSALISSAGGARASPAPGGVGEPIAVASGACVGDVGLACDSRSPRLRGDPGGDAMPGPAAASTPVPIRPSTPSASGRDLAPQMSSSAPRRAAKAWTRAAARPSPPPSRSRSLPRRCLRCTRRAAL